MHSFLLWDGLSLSRTKRIFSWDIVLYIANFNLYKNFVLRRKKLMNRDILNFLWFHRIKNLLMTFSLISEVHININKQYLKKLSSFLAGFHMETCLFCLNFNVVGNCGSFNAEIKWDKSGSLWKFSQQNYRIFLWSERNKFW